MDASVAALVAMITGRRVVALTGAGMSTHSGIPDYRGPETRRRARNPVQYQAFVSDPEARTRYWARATVGWPRIALAQPNPAHLGLAALERAGIVSGVITQNVDRLHHAAGSEGVVELHGALHEVQCLQCGQLEDRDALQARLIDLNPDWEGFTAEFAPDGDAELDPATIARFEMAGCQDCGGLLKPHVVFFGETVPVPTVEAAWALMDRGEVLLVAGSSLTVFSGYRFVRAAVKRGMPVAIVNFGSTRGDPQADLLVDGDVAEVLPALCAALT